MKSKLENLKLKLTAELRILKKLIF